MGKIRKYFSNIEDVLFRPLFYAAMLVSLSLATPMEQDYKPMRSLSGIIRKSFRDVNGNGGLDDQDIVRTKIFAPRGIGTTTERFRAPTQEEIDAYNAQR